MIQVRQFKEVYCSEFWPVARVHCDRHDCRGRSLLHHLGMGQPDVSTVYMYRANIIQQQFVYTHLLQPIFYGCSFLWSLQPFAPSCMFNSMKQKLLLAMKYRGGITAAPEIEASGISKGILPKEMEWDSSVKMWSLPGTDQGEWKPFPRNFPGKIPRNGFDAWLPPQGA